MLRSYAATTLTWEAPIPAFYNLTVEEQQQLALCGAGYARKALLDQLGVMRGVLTLDLDGSVRYCEPCRRIKPDRCHHCSVCCRCIPKMDHHCPWFSNCISFTTHKFFLLTLFYIVVLSTFCVSTTAGYLVKTAQTKNITGASLHITIMVLGGASLSFTLGTFLCSHVGMVLRNETTLEGKRAPVFRNPHDSFDIGRYQNFVQVFGHEMILWLIPVFTSLGNGVQFPTRLCPGPCAAQFRPRSAVPARSRSGSTSALVLAELP
ncbi:palmitoyltransferase ZDHHC2-like [Haemaphysalis longicornis]